MIMLDEDALICDLAETYHIYDYKSLPIDTVAILSSGLRNESRIRQKIRGFKEADSTIILAKIYDVLTEGKNPIAEMYFEKEENKNEKTFGFDSTEEFDEQYKKLLRS